MALRTTGIFLSLAEKPLKIL